MKEKNSGRKITGTDLGIIFSVIGIIASIILIVINFINDESEIVGIILLCACSASLSANVNNKKNEK